ncbi:hypothetical protein HGP14_26415 [Rhizobium sp. P32RR-XVIII]|uniref:flagellin N-terminal helical domain-containing protein n=1 Tax=Rhizobium sp. P32RR-XVIII TaxID=2726738 RepID=UPI0014570ACA|nr:flagellin [Rhizobium sp. P32RR-XVIII]NLS06848.1 hypothetical protein [Rhizobium sp. P32RR-XVIII]
MSSINTNYAAIAALQTLRSVNSDLENTQQHISSGLRVQTASDNAAYWSIATTMRSDNGATSAVYDALGLGAATIDTAYEGMSQTVDVLSQFRAKLVAATEQGLDRNKIQTELDQLKGQIVSIASSASFNGVNLLDTNLKDIEDTSLSTTYITAGFVRNENGSVSITKIPLDSASTSLLNVSGGGILQTSDKSPGTIGGLKDTMYDFPTTGASGGVNFWFSGPLTFTDDTTAITFDLTLDADDPATTPNPRAGVTKSFTINRSFIDSILPGLNGVISNAGQWSSVLSKLLKDDAYLGAYSGEPNHLTISSKEVDGTGSSFELKKLTSTLAGAATGGLANSLAPSYGYRAYTYSVYDGPFEMKRDVEATISINEAGVDKTITFSKSDVMAALGSSDGKVKSQSDFVDLMNYLFDRDGIGITASKESILVRYDLDPDVHPEAGLKSRIGVLGADDNVGYAPTFNLLDVDITGNADIDAYISGVDNMLQQTITAATTLGAVKSRIDMQSDFTSKLMDSISSGVGKLVDADMEEESSKLSALQTQQQLALQSLSIANSAPQILLSLFRQ